MTFAQQFDIGIGAVEVVATIDGGHPPEFYAERIVAKLLYVSESAPPEIKLQALVYQEALRDVVLKGVRRAILSNHTTILAQLRKAGMHEAAQLIYELHRR